MATTQEKIYMELVDRLIEAVAVDAGRTPDLSQHPHIFRLARRVVGAAPTDAMPVRDIAARMVERGMRDVFARLEIVRLVKNAQETNTKEIGRIIHNHMITAGNRKKGEDEA